VEFADGEVSKNVTVTITPDALTEPNENFTLTLSDPQGGIALGSPSVTPIRIVDLIDTTKPGVKITPPATGANLAEGASATLAGTASDNKGVLRVMFALNGGSFADAVTTVAASGLSATYTAALSPVPGKNTVAVKSVDTRNNESSIVVRTFNYNVLRPLLVLTDGTGTVPLPISPSSYKVGFPYTITVKPGKGQVFDGWTANDPTATGITTTSTARDWS
jgi:Bacterial Ig domain